MTRWTLPPDKIPTAWFNVAPHLTSPPQPPLHPGTREPIGPDDLAPLFPMALIGQEVSAEPWIDVPGEVLDILRLWRPTPLVRAVRLEKALGTPARIYFKDESVSPAGSHKPNTAVPQAFYNATGGHHAADHRDGRRAVGHRAGVRVRAVRPGPEGLHGPRVLRAEALPAGSRWRRGARAWSRRRSTSPTTPARWAARSPTRCATASGAPTPTTRSGPSSTTCCCTRP